MKYRIVVFLISLFLISPVNQKLLAWDTPAAMIQEIQNEEQETNYWCWPALVKQIIAWRGIGIPPPQCDLVNIANISKGWQAINCCDPALVGGPECSRLGDENELKMLISTYGGSLTGVPIPTTPMEVHDYLAARQLLIMLVEYEGNGNKHIYMVRGIYWEGEEAFVKINDPAQAQSQDVKFSEAKDYWQQTWLVR